jgi:hypothetical protein
MLLLHVEMSYNGKVNDEFDLPVGDKVITLESSYEIKKFITSPHVLNALVAKLQYKDLAGLIESTMTQDAIVTLVAH